MSLMEKFADPSLFDSLGFGDKMMGSLITMIMGMGITFAVLLLLWGFVAVMGRCISGMSDRKEKKNGEKTAAAAAQQGTQGSSDVSGSPDAPDASGDEVIAAVIAAAVAAYRSDGGPGELMVRKITRLSGESTAWSNAAIEDCIESRRF